MTLIDSYPFFLSTSLFNFYFFYFFSNCRPGELLALQTVRGLRCETALRCGVGAVWRGLVRSGGQAMARAATRETRRRTWSTAVRRHGGTHGGMRRSNERLIHRVIVKKKQEQTREELSFQIEIVNDGNCATVTSQR